MEEIQINYVDTPQLKEVEQTLHSSSVIPHSDFFQRLWYTEKGKEKSDFTVEKHDRHYVRQVSDQGSHQ